MGQWFADNGDKTLRQNYELDETSLVFDLGGYQGEWTSGIFEKYSFTIHVFEPVKEFAAQIERRFSKNEKIIVHRFGLSSETRSVSIALCKDSNSIFKQRIQSESIQLIRAIDFMRQNNINTIDLMKINIEGAEYDLIDHLIDSEFVKHIKNLQVQFHDFVPKAKRRRLAIQKSLANTHILTYQYPWVWENWKLKA